jgi:hypothetical protein
MFFVFCCIGAGAEAAAGQRAGRKPRTQDSNKVGVESQFVRQRLKASDLTVYLRRRPTNEKLRLFSAKRQFSSSLQRALSPVVTTLEDTERLAK